MKKILGIIKTKRIENPVKRWFAGFGLLWGFVSGAFGLCLFVGWILGVLRIDWWSALNGIEDMSVGNILLSGLFTFFALYLVVAFSYGIFHTAKWLGNRYFNSVDNEEKTEELEGDN